MCWASAALPPLPAIRSLLLPRKLAAMTSAIFRAASSRLASPPARSSASRESFRCVAMRSFEVGLKRQHPCWFVFGITKLNWRKRASCLTRRTADQLHHFFGHVGCGDIPHAAMIVHGADRAMAGLTRHGGFGLDGRRKAVDRRPVIGAGRAENAHGRRVQRGGDM